MPYIVRFERGAMDRGLYDVSVLADPTGSWAPWASQPGWNHKVLYQFGGGTAPWHTNGAPQNDLIDLALSRGFMVANNNLNIRGDDANDVVSAEALMMLKEHIAETYGRIRYTIGTGCSGGSIQQHVIARRLSRAARRHPAELQLPGQLDDGERGRRLPPAAATTSARRPGFTRRAAGGGDGRPRPAACARRGISSFAPVGIPSRVSNCNLQGTPFARSVYDPVTNPRGVRCDVQDYQSAIWGFRPSDGFARSPFANVGVQYGLGALNSGDDNAGAVRRAQPGRRRHRHRPQLHRRRGRSPDLVAQSIAYRTGQVTNGTQLANVPIIDLRGSEQLFNDIHTDYHSYVMRARLDAANGGHGNQLIWTWDAALVPTNIAPPPSIALKSFLTDRQLALEHRVGHAHISALAEGARRQAGDGERRVLHRRGADRDDRRGGVRGGVPALRRRAARCGRVARPTTRCSAS